MKKLFALFLATVMALSLTACADMTLGELADLLQQAAEDRETPEAAQGDSTPDTPAAADGSDTPDIPSAPSTPAAPEAPAEPAVAPAPAGFDLWAPLVGYWHAADGAWFLLDMADSHSAWFEQGIWDTGFHRSGPVRDLTLSGATIHTGTVHYDATEATAMDDARPAEEIALTVDWTDRDNDGKIRITLSNETYHCAFAGQTAEEAYAVHQQNVSDIAAAQ